ncbi:MAG: hypothetical protein ACKVVP_07310 [Chloroflexota bacterium]
MTLRILRALTIGFALVAGLYVLSWLTRWPIPVEFTFGLIAILIVSTVLGAVSRWPSVVNTAQDADRRLDLEERLLTAVDSIQTRRAGRIVNLQIANAVEAGHAHRDQWRMNRQAIRGEGGRACAAGFLAIGMFLIASLSDQLPLPRPDLTSMTNPAVGPLNPESQIPDPPPLPKPDTAGGNAAVSPVLRALDDLRRAREANGVSPEDAERRVAQAESEIQRQASQSQAQRQELNRLARGLAQTSAGRQAAESIQRGSFQQAGNQLTELGNEADQLSQEAKDQLSRELRAAAGETSQNRLLQERERRAAEALAGRDYAQQRRALRELGEEVARAGSFVVPQQDLAEGMSRIREERQDLEQSGASGQSDERQPLSASGQGSAQTPSGAPTTQGQQTTQSASQAGGTAPGSGEGSGQAANGSAPGGDQAGENRLDSAPRLEVVGRRVEVPVKVGRGTISERPGTEDPVDTEEASATITSTSLNQPQDPGTAAAERNLVPSDRRQTVRDYFGGESSR